MAEQKIKAWQIGKIKQLQKLRNMDDNAYRDALAEWDVNSSTKLSFTRANNLIALWRKLAKAEGVNVPERKHKTLKYNELDGRGPEWPSAKQLRLLDTLFGMVTTASKDKQDAAFAGFLQHRFGIQAPSQILKKDVQRIKKTLDEMKRQQYEKGTRKTNPDTQAQRATGTL